MSSSGARKVGVEEELMLVDPATGYLTAVAPRAVRAGDAAEGEPPVEEELFRQQIETQTPPVVRLDDLAEQVVAARRAVGEAAREAGAAAVAVASPVLVDVSTDVTDKPRYRRIRERYGELAASALASALHVHVDIDSREEGVRVLDGIGPWLPVLLAISANSPYSDGRDTGHASWRSQTWSRWPSHGTGEPFGTPEAYDEVRARLVEWGAALDDGMTYFDARLSESYPTVEIRVADVCADVEDTVLVAALARALVTTSDAGGQRRWRSDLLRAATWRASSVGIAGDLVDPASGRLRPARDVVASLVGHVRPALADLDDLERVEDGVERLFTRGNGAVQQRRAFETGGDLPAVVADLVRRTEASWGGLHDHGHPGGTGAHSSGGT